MRTLTFVKQTISILLILAITGCDPDSASNSTETSTRIPVIFDTDANNELDDQHALAYLLLNGQRFIVKGVTVNATFNGGEINEHYAEAERVIKLCNRYGKIPLFPGANASFQDIRLQLKQPDHDGHEAVDFIIKEARSMEKLTLIAVGKLTNVALALEKDPSIASKIRLVWLGSNYPEPGEYNQVNDTSAMNYLLQSRIPFEMVTVRYGKPSGTDAVRVTQEEINKNMKGKGPEISDPVTGRHGGSFTNFGDYSVSLFEHIDYHGDPPSRALFDMVAVAIVKTPEWGEFSEIPAPILISGSWVDRPENERKMGLWQNFKKESILSDFYNSFDNHELAVSE